MICGAISLCPRTSRQGAPPWQSRSRRRLPPWVVAPETADVTPPNVDKAVAGSARYPRIWRARSLASRWPCSLSHVARRWNHRMPARGVQVCRVVSVAPRVPRRQHQPPVEHLWTCRHLFGCDARLVQVAADERMGHRHVEGCRVPLPQRPKQGVVEFPRPGSRAGRRDR